MKENQQNKNRTYKMLASRGSEIIFDDRITADSPRDAREQMKKLLGLTSLSGIVYSVTEIPVELIREIVDGRVAELAGGEAPKAPVPADLEGWLTERIQPVLDRLAALEGKTAVESEPPARFDPLAEQPEETEDEPAATEPDWALVEFIKGLSLYKKLLDGLAEVGRNLQRVCPFIRKCLRWFLVWVGCGREAGAISGTMEG
jgi:hypothetical protein